MIWLGPADRGTESPDGAREPGTVGLKSGGTLIGYMSSTGLITSRLCTRNIKPEFHYADFHRNFSAGKVVDTNHESRRRDLYRDFRDLCPRQSSRTCRKVGIMKVGLK